MKREKYSAILFAIFAAFFYGINMPFSKLLLEHVPSTIMAGLLYLGAGIGIGIMYLLHGSKNSSSNKLSKKDLPYVIGMVLLDIFAPIFLMYGLRHTSSCVASLLNNFEIVATAIIALFLFKERISGKLWSAIFFVTISSMILSVEDLSAFRFSPGSFFVLLAAVCWGLENNCTKKISDKNTYQIVTIKGLCSGCAALAIGYVIGERLPSAIYFVPVLILGYVAYGLSIYFYIKAQNGLGAAKTSAYYAVAPFIGALLSFLILKEQLTPKYLIALLLMLIGTAIVTWETLSVKTQE